MCYFIHKDVCSSIWLCKFALIPCLYYLAFLKLFFVIVFFQLLYCHSCWFSPQLQFWSIVCFDFFKFNTAIFIISISKRKFSSSMLKVLEHLMMSTLIYQWKRSSNYCMILSFSANTRMLANIFQKTWFKYKMLIS